MDPKLQPFTQGAAKTVEHLLSEYSKLQTGRASAALIEHILVESYGQKQPLKAVASVSVQDAHTIVVQPWDKGVLEAIDKALTVANLGTMPVNEGAQIRIVLPPMTEERRKDLVKIVKELLEEARISIRQQRHDAHSSSKKDEDRSEDEHRDFEAALQKEVDKANAEIEDHAKKKEDDVMKV